MGLTWLKNRFLLIGLAAAVASLGGCKSSGGLGDIVALDETAEAGKIVEDANKELNKIKVLYRDNEGKRLEIRQALEANNTAEVRRLAGEIVTIINEGTNLAADAIDKLESARSMKINADYERYLELKIDSLKSQLEAFQNFHKAARTLRDNYDPKDAAARDKVKAEFEELTEKYRKTMEDARARSSEANDLYKDTVRKERQ
ncbi:MAG: hypothetical protein KF831_11625 [Acidobacteria bacterium]|nr:hypothetical protein [Acidobacteriota bacterium]